MGPVRELWLFGGSGGMVQLFELYFFVIKNVITILIMWF